MGCTFEEEENNGFGYGTLKIDITDAPFPVEYVDSANVSIFRVEARLSTDTSDQQFVTLSEDTVTYNLIELRNGVTENLVELELPEGEIDLIRLFVEDASLTLNNGKTYSVKVPSGKQTGIKIFMEPSLVIAGGLTTDLLLDFSLEKSFVLKGNMNTPAGIKGFNFKPVIHAINVSNSGSVYGTVVDTNMVDLENASVWIEQDTVVAMTTTDTTGYYAFPGIHEGTYMISATAENHDTVVVDEVTVTAANKVEVNFELTPEEEEEESEVDSE